MIEQKDMAVPTVVCNGDKDFSILLLEVRDTSGIEDLHVLQREVLPSDTSLTLVSFSQTEPLFILILALAEGEGMQPRVQNRGWRIKKFTSPAGMRVTLSPLKRVLQTVRSPGLSRI